MDEEWRIRVDCTETGCLRASLLSNTEAIKWRNVYLPIPIIRDNRVVKSLSIPIFRSNRFGERSIDTYRPKQEVWSSISIPIVRNNRVRLAVPMVYGPNRHALEVPIDSYLFQREVLIIHVNTVSAEQ